MQLLTSKVNSPQLNPTVLGNNFFEDISKLQTKKTFTNFQNKSLFLAEFTFGSFFSYIQRFSFNQKDDSLIFRGQSVNSFPTIVIVLTKEKSRVRVKDFKIERADNSVQGELLYTRTFLMLSSFRSISLNFKNIGLSPLKFSFSKLSSTDEEYMLFRAKLARKLKFIEEFFNTKFYLPERFEPDEVIQTEILYRGITEGEFSIPFDELITVFNYKLTTSDFINKEGITKKSFSFESNEDFLFLGKIFPVGTIKFFISKGSIANPRILQNYKAGERISELNVNVYDYQIHHKFEKYSNFARLAKSKQKLERFKFALKKVEPEFLVNLVDDYLSREISQETAVKIVEGLLQYQEFPDRFSVMKPKLQENCWKVPIALTYPKHEPILLTDAFVDVKTGKVEMKISFDELLKKGKKKAKEAFSIA